MEIRLLDKDYIESGKWLEKIYRAYRRCYSDNEFDQMKIPSREKQEEFIKKFSMHKSPLEHFQLTVHASGISRALSHQLVRHRIASYSQMSQRYVKDEPEYIVPETIKENEEALAEYNDFFAHVDETYRRLIELGIPQEDARYVFANGMETKIVISMNVRSWYRFFNERCCEKAQWEIRNLAKMILKEFRITMPVLFENAGPKCLEYKRCTEAKPCGKAYFKNGFLI